MILIYILYGSAILAVVWAIVSALVMVSFVNSRGTKINWWFLRFMVLKYIHQYYWLTKNERGKPGRWFYSYIVSLFSAFLCYLTGLILSV